jgi:hypothetical protein
LRRYLERIDRNEPSRHPEFANAARIRKPLGSIEPLADFLLFAVKPLLPT